VKQLFLAPRSNETAYSNFTSTLKDGVPYSRVEQFLTDSEKKTLANQNLLFIWGCQPALKDKWDKIQVGDYVLFYHHYKFVILGDGPRKSFCNRPKLVYFFYKMAYLTHRF